MFPEKVGGSVMSLAIISLIALLIAGCGGGNNGAESGKSSSREAVIAEVLDGDSVVTDDGSTVQIIGASAPETHKQGGGKAAAFTRELLEGKEVVLEPDVVERDEFGRLLRHIWVRDQLASSEIIGSGYAVFKASPPGPEFMKYTDKLAEAEERAEESGEGLWSEECLRSQIR